MAAAAQAIALPKSTIPTSPRFYTLEEYLRRESKSVDKHEFFNGIIRKMGNTKFYHNLIAANTTRQLGNILSELPYYVLGDGQKIYIESENVAVYPDSLVICEEPIFYKGMEHIITNPLVVIEVLSKSTAHYDKTDKFTLYKKLPSFKEYVMIDARKPYVETAFREEPDLWRFKIVEQMTDSIALRALNISMSLADIYQKVKFPTSK